MRPHADARSVIAHMLATARDPHTHELADRIDAWTAGDRSLGGRPLKHPTWALVVFGECVLVFKSISAVAREFADPDVWAMVVQAAQPHLAVGQPVPYVGPTRDQYYYLTVRLEGHLDRFVAALGELGATLIFAGNFQGRTQTMPLAIIGVFDAGRTIDLAIALSVILVSAAAVLLLLLHFLTRGHRPLGL